MFIGEIARHAEQGKRGKARQARVGIALCLDEGEQLFAALRRFRGGEEAVFKPLVHAGDLPQIVRAHRAQAVKQRLRERLFFVDIALLLAGGDQFRAGEGQKRGLHIAAADGGAHGGGA